MDKKKEKIKKAILDFENGKISQKAMLNKINKISLTEINLEDVTEFWGYTNIDNLVDRILISPIDDWKSIDDHKAITLIDEILNNLIDDVIIERNSIALEKRYAKRQGTISDWIFSDGLDDSALILKKLKENNTILLL